MPWWDVYSLREGGRWIKKATSVVLPDAGIREASGRDPRNDPIQPLITLMEMRGPQTGESHVFMCKKTGFKPHWQSYWRSLRLTLHFKKIVVKYM